MLLMGKSTISMAIFNSYFVKLPEGKTTNQVQNPLQMAIFNSYFDITRGYIDRHYTMVFHKKKGAPSPREEPIAGPPAWRFSVTLARVRAKAKETRSPGEELGGFFGKPIGKPGENQEKIRENGDFIGKPGKLVGGLKHDFL